MYFLDLMHLEEIHAVCSDFIQDLGKQRVPPLQFSFFCLANLVMSMLTELELWDFLCCKDGIVCMT